jgi:hypothetical protein
LTINLKIHNIVIKNMDKPINPNERVVHPSHYNKGIEMWDYAHSHNLDFFEGNVVKYVTRWRHKNGIEDLKKAKQYLDKLIEIESRNNQ